MSDNLEKKKKKKYYNFGIDNPCASDCELCDKKTGVCLKQQTKFNHEICDLPCDDDEECIDGECVWTNVNRYEDLTMNANVCNPPCLSGEQCINRRCESNLTSYCPVSCRPGQLCIDGRCGCYKGKILKNI